VSGAVQLQFTISDPKEPTATPNDILEKFTALLGVSSPDLNDIEDDRLERLERFESADLSNEDEEVSEMDDFKSPEAVAKKKKRLRLARLKKKAKEHGYEFSSGSDLAGVLFVEIQKISDLPPEKNGMLPLQPSEHASVLSLHSHSHWFRHGSIRSHVSGQKNLPHSSHKAQFKPCL
jgi:phosphatidylserine decarboxylase